ncbi:type I 3-dehydroquinate dehydratase, partial [Actinomyces radicidentis]|uniref:type I 3-dehydroquinate dehydratase n=1 Tax=Actinomyces radicidentis TaxID=111015 RepID=UPI0026E0DF29
MTISVRGSELGSGRPKIIVPITAKDLDGALDAVGALVGQDVDLVEWRIDYFRQDLTDLDAYQAAVIDGAQRLRGAFDELAADGQEGLPLLVTFRTAAA